MSLLASVHNMMRFSIKLYKYTLITKRIHGGLDFVLLFHDHRG